ncbi:MAG TPA: ABC transporter substrate-binding protein [Actinomycetes bacterium]|nr:ABC transporter substrate-binding protein [Actinomycetes bacterium]
MSRTRRSLRWGAVAIAGMVAGLLPLVTINGAQAVEQDGENIFVVGELQKVDNLNPFKGITVAAYETWALTYNTLTGYSAEDFSPVPQLAESWEASDDNLTWTYHLVDNATFTDGEPLTADDVVYTFKRVIAGESIEKTNYGSYVRNIETVKATDDYTVVMTVKEPTPVMNNLQIPILPEHIWSEIDSNELPKYTNEPDSDPPGMVGSGPFKLVEVVQGQSYRFEANPDYWAGAPNIDGVEFKIYQNDNSLVTALENGEIDFADDLDAKLFATLEGNPDIAAESSVNPAFSYITMNGGAKLTDGSPIPGATGHPSLQDPVVREAIHYAIDKEALVERTLDGRGEPGDTFIPPIYEDQHLEIEDPITYDPDHANELLDQAGYTLGPDGVRTMPDGSDPLVYQLYDRSTSKTSQTTMELVQGWLKDIGIDSNLETVSENRLYGIAGDGTFDMYEWGWSDEPDPDYMTSVFTCGQMSYTSASGKVWAGLNDSFYCNKEYDEVYEAQATEMDPAKRNELVKQAQQMVYDANAYIIYEYYDYLQAYRSDRYTNFTRQPTGDGPLLFQYGIYSYLTIEPVTDGGSDSDSTNTALIIGGVAAAAVLVGVIVWLATRGRRSSESDVE